MKKIKLFDPHIGKIEEIEIQKVLKSKFWAAGSGTANVGLFEKKFQNYTDTKSCIAVSSGTAALHLALSLYDLKNAEVIIPSLSFVATAHCIKLNQGRPVFVDVKPDTFCLDPDLVEESITSKTKMVLPVHFGGMPSELDKLKKICKKNGLVLVEDAAHATGASFSGKKIGKHGDCVCFSFHPVKNLAMPGGGAITLNNRNWRKQRDIIKIRRWCGIGKRKGPIYDVVDIGWNYYMNEFSAALGLVQLQKLDRLNNIRRKIAERYFRELLTDRMPYDERCSYHLYWICVKDRTNFIKKMSEADIEVGIHYLPIHKMTYYNESKKLPVTEKVTKNIVSLPMHPNLTEKEVSKVIKYANKFC